MTSHIIEDFDARVYRNDSEITFARYSFSRTSDNVAPSWQIDLGYPINLNEDDTWSISRGWGGDTYTLIENEKARQTSSRDGFGSASRSVSGQAEATDLLEYCIPKTLVFINDAWLNSKFASAEIRDNIVKVESLGGTYTRVYHPRLPDESVGDDDFYCISGQNSHHSIGSYLAGIVGYDLRVNTPDIDLVDTFTVPSGTSFFDAIKSNFTIWQPDIQVIDNDIEKAIYITDVLTEDGELDDAQIITLSNSAIKSVSRDDSEGNKERIVDHVIVTGRTLVNTLLIWPQDNALEVETVPLVSLIEDNYHEYTIDYSDVMSEAADIVKTYGSGDSQFTTEDINTTNVKEYWHEDEVTGEKITCRSIVTTYQGATMKSRRTEQFYFGPDKRPAGSIIEEEARVRYPGNETPQWKTIRTIRNLQHQFIKGVKKGLSSTIEEGLVVYEEDSEGNKLSPVPLHELLLQDKGRDLVDQDPDTAQDAWEQTYRVVSYHVGREDTRSLALWKLEYDVLADHMDFDHEFLENPLSNQNLKQDEDRVPRQWEFKDGAGALLTPFGAAYHPPVRISHEDIVDSATAGAVADRVFYRKNTYRETLRIDLNVPLPVLTLPFLVEVPSFEWTVNGESVTVSGGEYVCRGVSESVSYQGRSDGQISISVNQTLTLRSKY